MRPQDDRFVQGRLRGEVFGKALRIAADLFIEAFGRNAEKSGEIVGHIRYTRKGAK